MGWIIISSTHWFEPASVQVHEGFQLTPPTPVLSQFAPILELLGEVLVAWPFAPLVGPASEELSFGGAASSEGFVRDFSCCVILKS